MRGRSVEVRQLELFACVIESSSVTKAAEKGAAVDWRGEPANP